MAKQSVNFAGVRQISRCEIHQSIKAVNAQRPGPCTQQERAKFIVVKDRNGDDDVAVCIQRNGKYQWHVIKDLEPLIHESCKEILTSSRNNGDGVYQISVGNNTVIDVYCQMTNVSGCKGGGWTLAMKINGSLSTFKYSSSYWTSKNAYNDDAYGRNGGLDNREYKGSTYWRTSFKEICVVMKYGGRLRAFSFSYPASSLYNLIADGNHRQTQVGRAQWKSLISGSSLQLHCNREGFNLRSDSTLSKYRVTVKVRLGIIANQQNHCDSPDSYVGLGAEGGWNYPVDPNWCQPPDKSLNSAGNLGQCSPDNGNKNTKAMAYILVR
ncbi:Hypothetical predicted protein [Paramuricea clavata]|uniref:Uncharacterized protein n=1 Tax=Paramuricea clavata TaxID=317549 RepID=A0A7D9IZE1_PARCT|nr:Hypothetical predicted protein [Paramuricea clavata]